MSTRFTTLKHSYKIKEVLGESPSCLVYLAYRYDKDFNFQIPLVIKLFKKKESPAFALQMESLLRARHSPHLIKVLSFEKIRSRPALILEYISGLNLKQLIKNIQLNKNEIACICSQVLSGLKELKENGLAHGDISLSNILVRANGQVYLTDYGLSNYANNLAYGTKPFTAPELYNGSSACFSSDLFSLGVLEKILSGPFTEEHINSLQSSHFVQKADPLLSADPHKRKEKSFSFSPSALHSLGNKVHKLNFNSMHFFKGIPFKNRQVFKNIHPLKIFNSMYLLKNRQLLKRMQLFKNFAPFRGQVLGLIFCLFLFSSNPFISYGKHSVKEHPAEVLVRTKKWVYVQMAGFYGYPPINIRVKKPGSYKLKWKSLKKSGVKYVYLSSGQKIILKDRDFL